MITLCPWINFNGDAEEAFTFYKSVFGGEFTAITRFKDVAGPDSPVSDDEAEKVMKIILSFGGTMLIGNDVPAFMGKVSESENRSKIYVALDSKEELERIFHALSVEGEVEVDPTMGDTSSVSSFAMFRDRYGIEWVLDFSPAQ